MPEKILTSFQSVHDQNVDEQDAFNKFKSAVLRAAEIKRNAEGMSSLGMSHVLCPFPKLNSIFKTLKSPYINLLFIICFNYIVYFFLFLLIMSR